MEQEKEELQDSVNPEGEEETLEPQKEEDPKDQPKKEEKNYEELYNNQRIRAAKAEQELKKFKDTKVESDPNSNLSQKDLITLIKADITEDEDIEMVSDYAKMKNISLQEAIKRDALRSILAEQREERATANATSTGGGKKGSSQTTDSELLRRAKSGKVPESDEEIRRLAEARFKSKIRKK